MQQFKVPGLQRQADCLDDLLSKTAREFHRSPPLEDGEECALLLANVCF
jgi:hypothetical protein